MYQLTDYNRAIQQDEFAMKTLTVAEICQLNDLPIAAVERALDNLQERGLVSGFVPGDVHAQITLTEAAAQYFN